MKWLPSTCCCPPRTAQTRCYRTDVDRSTSATPDALAPLLDGVDLVCHQAAMVGAGVDAADAPAYGGHNDFAHHGAAGADVRCRSAPPGAGVVDGGLRTGRAIAAPSTDRSSRCRGGVPTSTPGLFEHRCPLGGEELRLAARRRGCRAATAQPVRGQQDRPGALRAGVVGVHRRLGGRAALPQRLRPRHAARHPVLRGGGDLPLGSGKGRATKGFRRWRPDARLRPRRRRGRRQPRGSPPATTAQRDGFTAVNVCSGRPISILEVATALCDARDGSVSPVITGQYRSGDVRHIVADPARAADGAGFPRGGRSARGPARIRVRAAALIRGLRVTWRRSGAGRSAASADGYLPRGRIVAPEDPRRSGR